MDHPAPNPNLRPCPNCGATMNEGDRCPECEHYEDGSECDCAWFISQAPPWSGEVSGER